MINFNEIVNQINENVLGVKGKRNAQNLTEVILDQNNVRYNKAQREGFTHYYLEVDEKPEGVARYSLAITDRAR